MKMRVLILLFFNTLCQEANGTVDVSVEAYHYVVDNLTTEECRTLVASLHFVTDDLPTILQIAEEKIPLRASCYDLLTFWNGGKEKWQGWGKSHEIVTRRLRQFGKDEIARHVSVMVFHNLAEDINKTIINYVYEDNRRDAIPKRKLVKKTHPNAYKYWEIYDTLLLAGVIILSGAVLFSCCRIVYLVCRKLVVDNISHQDELQYLLRDRFASIELDS